VFQALKDFDGQAWEGNFALLRAVAAAWSAAHQQDADLASGGDDAVDTSTDHLTGGTGADWFIISVGDILKDYNQKSGDLIEYV
jgi:hypothetical protein